MTWVPGGAALLVGLAAAPAASAAPQALLRDARVRIDLRSDTARVVARYHVTDAGDSLRFNAIRTDGQALDLTRVMGERGIRLDTLPGLFRVLAGGRGRRLDLELRYDVAGDLTRIPLFVPDVPAAPGQSRLVILVDGLAPGRAARFPFPRFSSPGPRLWVSTPDHLPAFVALVAGGGAPVPVIAQWSVLVIALGGTGAWLLAQWHSRRRR